MRRAYECSGTLDSGLEENWALRMSVRKFAFIVAVSLVPIAGFRRLPWNFALQLQQRGQCYP